MTQTLFVSGVAVFVVVFILYDMSVNKTKGK